MKIKANNISLSLKDKFKLAIEDNNIKEVERLLINDKDLINLKYDDTQDGYQLGVLDLAASKAHNEIIDLLINYQASINHRSLGYSNDSRTAIHYAVINNHYQTMTHLINHHKLDFAYSDFITALKLAASNAHIDLIDKLINHHALDFTDADKIVKQPSLNINSEDKKEFKVNHNLINQLVIIEAAHSKIINELYTKLRDASSNQNRSMINLKRIGDDYNNQDSLLMNLRYIRARDNSNSQDSLLMIIRIISNRLNLNHIRDNLAVDSVKELELGLIESITNSRRMGLALANQIKIIKSEIATTKNQIEVTKKTYVESVNKLIDKHILDVKTNNKEMANFKNLRIILIAAIKTNQIKVIEHLVNNYQLNVNAVNNNLLAIAIKSGQNQMIDYLINNYNLTLESFHLFDALYWAQSKTFDYLIDNYNLDVNINRYHFNYLFYHGSHYKATRYDRHQDTVIFTKTQRIDKTKPLFYHAAGNQSAESISISLFRDATNYNSLFKSINNKKQAGVIFSQVHTNDLTKAKDYYTNQIMMILKSLISQGAELDPDIFTNRRSDFHDQHPQLSQLIDESSIIDQLFLLSDNYYSEQTADKGYSLKNYTKFFTKKIVNKAILKKRFSSLAIKYSLADNLRQDINQAKSGYSINKGMSELAFYEDPPIKPLSYDWDEADEFDASAQRHVSPNNLEECIFEIKYNDSKYISKHEYLLLDIEIVDYNTKIIKQLVEESIADHGINSLANRIEAELAVLISLCYPEVFPSDEQRINLPYSLLKSAITHSESIGNHQESAVLQTIKSKYEEELYIKYKPANFVQHLLDPDNFDQVARIFNFDHQFANKIISEFNQTILIKEDFDKLKQFNDNYQKFANQPNQPELVDNNLLDSINNWQIRQETRRNNSNNISSFTK